MYLRQAVKIISIFVFMLTISNSVMSEVSIENNIIKSNKTHQIKVLTHGLASLKERIDLIQSSKSSIDLEYFIFNADDAGKIILNNLIEKSKQGVKVRLLLDGFFGKSEINEFIVKRLNENGIEVKYYNQLSLIKGNNNKYRNHRKLLIVDNQSALTGGRNIGNEYFDLGKKFSFLDREILIKGEVVSSLTQTFEEVWNSKFSKPVIEPFEPSRNNMGEGENQAYDLYVSNIKNADDFLNSDINEKILNYINTVGTIENEKSLITSCQQLNVITEKPIADKEVKKNRMINDYLLKKINDVSFSVVMETPYFTFSDKDEAVLTKVLERNVQVDLLTNGANSTDVKISAAAIDKLLRKWLLKGINFFLFNGSKVADYKMSEGLSKKAFLGLHAKTYIFDNKDIIIGSYNYDFISSKYNDEIMIECENAPEEYVEHVIKDIKKRMDQSILIKSELEIDEIGKTSIFYNSFKFVTSLFYKEVVN